MNLLFDIETIPAGDPDDIEVKAPANYKKPEAIEKYIAENRDHEFRKGALQGISGEIVSIAYQLDRAKPRAITRDHDTSEASLLNDFCTAIVGDQKFPRFKWIAHNAEWDLRFLKQRLIVNRIQASFQVPADAKHGDWSFCTMKEWAGWKGYVSQDALYKVLGGQPYENDDMNGADIYDAWLAGAFDKIRDYNIRDVEKLAFNYERLTA